MQDSFDHPQLISLIHPRVEAQIILIIKFDCIIDIWQGFLDNKDYAMMGVIDIVDDQNRLQNLKN